MTEGNDAKIVGFPGEIWFSRWGVTIYYMMVSTFPSGRLS